MGGPGGAGRHYLRRSGGERQGGDHDSRDQQLGEDDLGDCLVVDSLEARLRRNLRGDLAGQGGLADLAWTKKYHGGCLVQALQDAVLASSLERPRLFDVYR